MDRPVLVKTSADALLDVRMLEIAQRLQDSVRWVGVQIEQMPTIAALLTSLPEIEDADEREIREALEFFGGAQWPRGVKVRRVQDGRPTLVVNWLPMLLAGAIDAQRRAGLPPPSPTEIQRAKRVLVATHADAQRMHNFLISALTEHAMREGA